jgi:hypothetical protein
VRTCIADTESRRAEPVEHPAMVDEFLTTLRER